MKQVSGDHSPQAELHTRTSHETPGIEERQAIYRVLIIDEDERDRDLCSRSLSPSPDNIFGCTMLFSHSIEEGVQFSRALNPDCIILDFELCSTDYRECLQTFKRNGITAPVIGVCRCPPRVRSAIMRAGAYDCFHKDELDQSFAQTVLDAIRLSHRHPTQARTQVRNKLQLEMAIEQVSYLSMACKRLTVAATTEEILNTVIELAANFFGKIVFLDLLQRNGTIDRVVGRTYLGRETSHTWTAPPLISETGSAYVMRHERARYYAGAQLEALAEIDADIAFLQRQGLKTLMMVPLATSNHVLGVLAVGNVIPGGLGLDQRPLLEEFAYRAAMAIDHVRVNEQARKALDAAMAARKRLNFQAQVSTLLATSLDWRETLNSIMRKLSLSLCDTASLYIYEAHSQSVYRIASASRTPEIARRVEAIMLRYQPTFGEHIARYGVHSSLHSERHNGKDLLELFRHQAQDDEHLALLTAWAPAGKISVPLGTHANPIGILTLSREQGGPPFTFDDQTLAEDLGRRITAYLENARTFEREKAIATALQHSLLPNKLPALPDMRIASRYIAGAQGMQVGGDWYDVMKTGENRIVVAVGDVAGRGVLAAAIMGQMRNILRAYIFEGHEPGGALKRVNDLMQSMAPDSFATVVCMVIDLRENSLRYACAGHPPPLLAGPDGTVRVLNGANSMPVGVSPHEEFPETVSDFPPGSTLLLYTDGLVETRTRCISDGIAQVKEALSGSARSPEILVTHVFHHLASDRSDDTVMLAIHRSDPANNRRKIWSFTDFDARGASELRAEITRYLGQNAACGETVFDSALVVGELISNVARYAPGKVDIEIDWCGTHPVLHVQDYGSGYRGNILQIVPPPPERLGGRGLFFVKRLGRDFSIIADGSDGTYACVRLPVQYAAKPLARIP